MSNTGFNLFKWIIILLLSIEVISGIYIKDTRFPVFTVCFFFSFFSLGLFFKNISISTIRTSPRSVSNKIFLDSHKREILGARILVYLVFGLAVYHYSVVGISIFHDSFETERFDYGASGFFGLPGKCAAMGGYLLFSMGVVGKYRSGKHYFHLSGIVCGLILILLLGHKSAVIGCILITLIYLDICNNTNSPLWLLRILAPIVVIAFLYGYIVSFYFASISEQGTVNYLIDRVTSISLAPRLPLYSGELNHLQHNKVYLLFGDMLAPLLKSVFHTEYYGLNRVLSEYLYGSKNLVTIPVTPGPFAYHYYFFGYFAFILMFMWGLFFSYLISKARRKFYMGNYFASSFLIFIIVELYFGFEAGNPLYLFVVLLPFVFLFYITKTIMPLIKSIVPRLYSNF